MTASAVPTVDGTPAPPARPSPWAPLRHRVFRALFAAQLASNVGSFFQAVAAAWLMGDLTSSATLVALVQTATLLPTLLLGFPAGALADIVDRRKLLVFTQLWMLVCAGALAALTMADLVTPTVLLTLTFAMGAGGALMGPAWQAIQPDLVPSSEFGQAVALSSMTFNTGRAIGPALGGALVAAAGPEWAFLVNAASFFGVTLVLVGWRREQVAPGLNPESLSGAIRAGWRYSVNAPMFRGVLIRTAAFCIPASAIQALLPTVVRDRLGMGSGSYGLLLGAFGIGAIGAAIARPRIGEVLSPDRMMVVAALVVSVCLVVVGTVTLVPVVGIALLAAGAAWTTATVTTNVSAQSALPWWVRARGLGLYMLVLAGGIALGSAALGAVAAWSIPGAHVVAAGVLLVATPTVFRWRLDRLGQIDFRPAVGSLPMVQLEPEPEDGPVLVTVEYRVDEQHHEAFTTMMRSVERERRRSGAYRWGLFRDLADTDLFVETFVVDTWSEHMRQHRRRTVNADVQMRRVKGFVATDITVGHLISAYSVSGRRRLGEQPSESDR